MARIALTRRTIRLWPKLRTEINSHKLRLYNFGGKDLMMDVHFRKISLEDANRYNLSRKFIRVVNYKSKEVEYTALEINFDSAPPIHTARPRIFRNSI